MSHKTTSIRSSNATSSSRALRLEAAARKAELVYEAEALRRKQEIEREELQLVKRHQEEDLLRKAELEELKWKRQLMEIDLEVAAADARLKFMMEAGSDTDSLLDYDHYQSETDAVEKWVLKSSAQANQSQPPRQPSRSQDDTPPQPNEHFSEASRQPKHLVTTSRFQPSRDAMFNSSSDAMYHSPPHSSTQHVSRPLSSHDITSLLLENHVRSSLPKQTIQPFSGDALEFNSFIRSFEYNVEQRTNKNMERLYYLEQYTRGEANSLVKSCMLMPEDVGYNYAKNMLHKRFGNRHKIVESYLARMRAWGNLKQEDAPALQ